MNTQEAFTKMVLHLRQQKKRSRNNGSCAYRGNKGLSCAVGCLIPDKIYDPEMERKSVYELFNNFPQISKHFKDVDVNVLYRMQHIHDGIPSKEWDAAAAKVAQEYGLEFPL